MAMPLGRGARDSELEAADSLAATRLEAAARAARSARRMTAAIGGSARSEAAALTSAPPLRRGRACIPQAGTSKHARSSRLEDNSALTSGSPRRRLRA